MEWKCCRLKFNNEAFLIATDGKSLRVRGGGAIQSECELVDCDAAEINEIDMQLDIVLQEFKNGGS